MQNIIWVDCQNQNQDEDEDQGYVHVHFIDWALSCNYIYTTHSVA